MIVALQLHRSSSYDYLYCIDGQTKSGDISMKVYLWSSTIWTQLASTRSDKSAHPGPKTGTANLFDKMFLTIDANRDGSGLGYSLAKQLGEGGREWL